MKPGDVLLKKWCFGIGRAKPRTMMGQQANGEGSTYVTYPKYRTIAVRIESAEQKGKVWHVKGTKFASLTGKPTNVELVFEEKKVQEYSTFITGGQNRPFHLLPAAQAKGLGVDEGMPPVGSLINLNKKHALVVAVGRNELTVFRDGKRETVAFRPGSIRWHSDKLLLSMAKAS